MSLPPGFLDELRARISLAQVVGRKVTWDRRKSNQGRGDWWAPCPFHQEKTASFHVDDKKGFYYCFGCQAKGDAISFVKETENVSFIEAVEILAREAGMQMPARDPKAQARAERASTLAEVMEAAVRFYRLQLAAGAGARAREYLAGRGLGPEAQERWQLGYAPDARQALWTHLREKGIEGAKIVEAGLAIAPEDGGTPFDRFRGRVIFPIRDARGRAISLGGRALDPNARAKYLNGPETPLFDKGRALFNHGPAREAAGKGAPLIVAEGYMDVIALVEAGFAGAVAPLGTAITEAQLGLLWRIAPEPVVALDGDKAGLAAAHRLIDRALPLITAGQSLRFALLPQGLDPDDLIRAQGAAAMQGLIERALPMAELLWRRETEGRVFDSPERRAAFDRDIKALLGRIKDAGLRAHYEAEFRRRRQALFAPARGGGAGRGARGSAGPGRPWQGQGTRLAPPPLSETRGSLLAAGREAATEGLREAVILATLIIHPGLVETFLDRLETLEMSTPDHRAILGAILRAPEGEDLRATVARRAGEAPLSRLFALGHVQIAPAVRHPEDTELARQSLAEELDKLATERALRAEIAEAARDLAAGEGRGVDFRLAQAAQARQRATQAREEDLTLFDVADSGALVDRSERAALDSLLDEIARAVPGAKAPSKGDVEK